MKPQLLFALLLAPLLFVSSCKDKQAQEDALEELSDASDKLKNDYAKQLKEGGAAEHDPAALDDLVTATKKLEASASGDEAKSIKVMRIFMESVQTDSTNLANAQGDLTAALDYSQVKEASDIDALSEKVKTYQKLNTGLMTKVKSGWLEELNTNLDKEGVSATTKNLTIQGFNAQMNPQKPHLITIREADEQLCSAILKQHQILKDNFGKWKWNASAGAPEFTDNKVIELYNKEAHKMQDANKKQIEAQRNLYQVSQ